jgi:response regulator of citrate/malate metabolism
MSEVDVDKVLTRVKESLESAAVDLSLNVVRLEKELDTAKREYKRVEKTLTVLAGKKNTGKRSSSNSKNPTGKPPTADQLLKVMNDSEKEDWTVTEIANVTELHPSTAGKSMAWLRENNLIRATRSVQGGGHAYAAWKE